MYINCVCLIIYINLPLFLCFKIHTKYENVYLAHKCLGRSGTRKTRISRSSYSDDTNHAKREENETFVITTPLFYLNGDPHLGHSYTVVFADVIKRFLELKGDIVKLIVGTDEHGSKIERRSKLFGQNPKDYVSEYRNKFLDMFSAYDISADVSVHTSEDKNKALVERLFKVLFKRGFIYRGIHKGYFSPKEDLYFPQSQISNGKSPQGFDVVPVNETAYFFKLSCWREKLIEFFTKHKKSVVPETRYNEIMKILESELQDFAITRRKCNWGLKPPCICDISEPINCTMHGASLDNDSVETFYVWFDALLGYLSGLLSSSYINMDQLPGGVKTETDNKTQVKNALVQVIGKDILTFHSFLWPALLFSLDVTPFRKLYVHGWILCKGEKMSKSYGSVTPATPLESSDISRFMLMSLGQFGNDFEFSPYNLKQSENVVRNTFAAACYRVTGLLNARGTGKITFLGEDSDGLLNSLSSDKEVLENFIISGRIDRYLEHLENMALKINRFLTLHRVWKLQPEDPNFKNIIWTACSSLMCLSIHTLPIMPKLAKTIISRLNPELNNTPLNQDELRFTILDKLEDICYSPIHGEPLI